MDRKFESDDIKRQFLGLIAETCAELFVASHYPSRAFDFPSPGVPEELAFPIAELHMRMPAAQCLPKALRPPLGHTPSPDEQMTILRCCPAIERIQLQPEFQRYGFLNALMRELSYRGIPYVNISNIGNGDLALHYLDLSRSPGTGVELTSAPTTDGPTIFCPTFSINLKERFGS